MRWLFAVWVALVCAMPGLAQEAAKKETKPAAAQSPAKQDGRTGAPKAGDDKAAPAPPAPRPEATQNEIANIEDRITTLDADISALEAAQPQVEGAAPNPQLEFMRRARLLHQRRLTALKRIEQLEAHLAPKSEEPLAEQDQPAPSKPEGDAAIPANTEAATPITIQDFDQLLDDLDAAQRALESRQQAAASQEEAARRANAARDEAARARRAAEEAHNAATASGGGLTEFAVLEEARRAEALAELQAKVEEALLRVAGLEVQLANEGVNTARMQVRAGAQRLQFTQESLDALLAEVQERRVDLQKRLDHLYSEREKDSEALFKRRQQLQTATPEQEAAARERVEATELALNTTNAGIENLEKRLNNLAEEERTWTMRAQLRRGTLQGSRPRLLEETRDKLELLRDEIQQAEARGRDTLASRLETEERLANPELPEEMRAPLEKRIVAIDEQEESDREFLADLTRQEKLLRRLEWSLNREVEEQGFRAAWSVAREYITRFWYHELFVYEDRGYTVSNIFYALMAYTATLTILLILRNRLHKLLAKILANRIGENNAGIRDAGLTFINGTSTMVLMVLSLYPTLQFLPLGDRARSFISTLFYVAIVAQFALYLTGYMERAMTRYKLRRIKEDPSSVSALGVISFFGRIAVWLMVAVLTLQAFGKDITALAATLGVGGIAVAFALQSILADIFSSVAILLDKPFVVGDVITVGDNTGEVQSIGLKTTRIKSVSGEQVVISNNDLLGSRIHNFKRMSERRILFNVNVSYGTRVEHLELIPQIMKEAVENQEKTRFSRAHFRALGDAAMAFECEYFMTEPDYLLYTQTHQRVNLHIFRRFQEEGICFASAQPRPLGMEGATTALAVAAEQKPSKGMS